VITAALAVACLLLALLWLDEKRMRRFWHEMWWKEARFSVRIIDERGRVDPGEVKAVVDDLIRKHVRNIKGKE